MPYHFQEIPSTQLFLKKLAQSDPNLGHLEYAVADLQSAGVGRQGRKWSSEKGNLSVSIYLRDFSLPLTWVPHWVGVSLIDSLVSMRVPRSLLRLKWPNDLTVNGNRKAGGILCEKVGDGVVAGIGVNLVSAPELSDRETACIQSIAPKIDFFQVHLKLCESILNNLKKEPDLAKLKADYQNCSLLIPGSSILWTDLQTQEGGVGTFLRYGDFGELVVRSRSKEKTLYSEEIKLNL